MERYGGEYGKRKRSDDLDEPQQVKGDSEKQTGPKRASQACLACRKRKVRCLGGWPCQRCLDSNKICDFGPTEHNQPPEQRGSTSSYSRLEQLESNVATLLAGLAGTSTPNSQIIHSLTQSNDPDMSTLQSQGTGQPSWHTDAPKPRVDHVRFSNPPLQPSLSSEGQSNPSKHQFPSNASPFSANTSSLSPGIHDTFRREEPLEKGQQAEERLAVATEGVFAAPFKALAYHPSVWDNREASRRNSPERTAPPSRDDPSFVGLYDRRHGRNRDDPVNTGIVNLEMAQSLFAFFFDHCHCFFPIVDVTLEDPFETLRSYPPLFSAIIAIAARFYNKHTSRVDPTAPLLDPPIPNILVNLAEFHLAQTLLRKRHTLYDVQSILLLAAWCLVGQGGGPDAWVITGHAVRVARRLGVHKALAEASEMVNELKPGSRDWSQLERYLPQWRTWLCWLGFDGLFSLGFGRPQSTHLENLDEKGLLQIRLHQPLPRPKSPASVALHGDLYIAGQVQLLNIGRDLKSWGEKLAEPDKTCHDSPSTSTLKDMTPKEMFSDLNHRLDEWSKLWVWSGSPYAMYLGSSAKTSSLLADHMRLCLNSYPLKYSPDQDEYIADCLRKAFNAAVLTIQTHYESTQADFALSFVTDYLTITVAQAALFLIRMTKSPERVQKVVSLDPDVIAHYLQMSIDLLEVGDMSETHLSTFLAKTIRDMSTVAGIAGFDIDQGKKGNPQSSAFETAQLDSDLLRNNLGFDDDVGFPPNFGSMVGFQGEGRDWGSGGLDFENFLQLGAQYDLEYLLGIPGNSSTSTFP